MNDDKIWSLVGRIKAENIWLSEMSVMGTSLGDENILWCEIDSEKANSEWAQVFVLLHEAFHDDPELGPRKPVFRDPELEQAIDQKAIRVICTRPDIVAYVTKQLRQAKIFELHRSLVPYVSAAKIMVFQKWVKDVEKTGIRPWVKWVTRLKD